MWYVCILERVVLSIATKLVLTMKTIVLLQNIMNIFDKNERMGQYKQRDNQGIEDGKSGREGGNRKIRKWGEKQENRKWGKMQESTRGSEEDSGMINILLENSITSNHI